MNKVFLLGRLTKDVEIRTTPTGKQVANTSLATNKKWKDEAGNWQDKAEFHNLVIWQNAETFAKYVKRGHKVFIEGEISTRAWQDKEGNKKYTTEIIVRNFIFLENKAEVRGETATNKLIDDFGGEVVDDINIQEIPF